MAGRDLKLGMLLEYLQVPSYKFGLSRSGKHTEYTTKEASIANIIDSIIVTTTATFFFFFIFLFNLFIIFRHD
jgi:hypothetical protein